MNKVPLKYFMAYGNVPPDLLPPNRRTNSYTGELGNKKLNSGKNYSQNYRDMLYSEQQMNILGDHTTGNKLYNAVLKVQI